MIKNKKILFAVLNWGLGHATRSIPLINELIKNNNEIILASDGQALDLLQKEFPKLQSEKLPAYNIHYSSNKYLFLIDLVFQTPKIIKAIRNEHQKTKELVSKYNIDYIISDNRYGVYQKDVYSVFMTHQLRVLSGLTTWFSTKIQKKLIKSNEIWIPDFEGDDNLSGKLSHNVKIDKKTIYLGVLSRFKYKEVPKQYDILAILSGVEPQRSLLEKILLREFQKSDKKIGLVQGVVENEQKLTHINGIDIYNYLLSDELENLINASEIIISRSGYTSIMDYYVLKKKVFFIPTPGQTEQIYLAKYLDDKSVAPYCFQQDFELRQLNRINDYKGLEANP